MLGLVPTTKTYIFININFENLQDGLFFPALELRPGLALEVARAETQVITKYFLLIFNKF
jgi:hypothetical protein